VVLEPKLIVGIAGGSCSGKTTLVEQVVATIGTGNIEVLNHDAYYRHRPELTLAERNQVNYDHPDALETELAIEHLEKLCSGTRAPLPIYDFSAHLRSTEVRWLTPTPVLVIEGILVLHQPELRAFMDLKVFVDADPDVRALRRMERDQRERGRTMESVQQQFLESVKPMHDCYVDPSRNHADLVIPNNRPNPEVLRTLEARLRAVL
jgi:uridine kinase|tara:strand:+ start:5647 stop:6267 length:621 start_codon:yes stop_codon:yes gene_type:complete